MHNPGGVSPGVYPCSIFFFSHTRGSLSSAFPTSPRVTLAASNTQIHDPRLLFLFLVPSNQSQLYPISQDVPHLLRDGCDPPPPSIPRFMTIAGFLADHTHPHAAPLTPQNILPSQTFLIPPPAYLTRPPHFFRLDVSLDLIFCVLIPFSSLIPVKVSPTSSQF